MSAAWTDLGDGIRVRQSRAYAMNSLVLLDPDHTVIVDPGVLPSELDDIAAVVADRRPRRTTLIFSHAHWDHVLGRAWWPDAETVAHAFFAGEVATEEPRIRAEASAIAEKHVERFAGEFHAFTPAREVRGEHELVLGPWRLIAREAPGHSATQITLQLPDRRLLFAADMLSDIEIPTLDGPCPPYRRTLDGLLPRFQDDEIETLVPGHGSIARGAADCAARLLFDLLYLVELEIRVRAARDAGLTLDATQQALAGMEYAVNYREQPDWPLAPLHAENVRFAYEGLARERG